MNNKLHMPDGSTHIVPNPDVPPMQFEEIEIDFFKLLRKHFPLETDEQGRPRFRANKRQMHHFCELIVGMIKSPPEILGVAWAPELSDADVKVPMIPADVESLRAALCPVMAARGGAEAAWDLRVESELEEDAPTGV